MSDIESESESDLDFSASEDEYVPDGDSDSEEEVEESPKKIDRAKQKRNVRTEAEDDDSDSSVENYLVNPNEIDLASDFFNPDQTIKTVTTTVPQFDCNVGLNLSDSEEEVFEAIPSTSRAAAGKVLDFNAHENFNKNLENAKEQLRNFKSTDFGQDSCDVDVTKLLAIGEPSLVAKKSSKTNRKLALSSSDESDFEEVEEDVKTDKKSNVEVRIGPVVKQKADKRQAEIDASIKRKINRMKKEKQLMMHKVHLLSWIAYGNFVNKVLNSTKLMEMMVKFIPSETCYPKEQTDHNYFEQIVKWFKTTVGLKHKEQNCNLKCLPPLSTSLALQIQSKMAICKKDFVFIFVILLRSMGIQCRLVINFATVPLRPAAKDLCVISTKSVVKSESGDQTKRSKESTKNAEKDVKKSSKPKADKSKSRTITGKKSEIQTESPEATTGTKSLKSKIEAASSSQANKEPNDDKKPNLKRRAASVQSVSSINGNSKRSRNKNSDDTKATIAPTRIQNAAEDEPSTQVTKKNLKRRSLSLQSTSSSGKDALTSNRQKTKAATNDVNPSPISRRTRRALTRNATITSQTVPQLDGGDDKKGKSRKPNLYKIKFPLRSRSISPSSSNATEPMPKTIALVSPRSRATSRGLRLRLPPTSRSKSKSPTSTSGHISRKSKSKEMMSRTTSPSPTKTASKLEKESKSPGPSSMKNDSPLKLTPVKLKSNPSKTLSDMEAKKKSTSKPSSKSPVPSNAPVAVGIDSPSPVKLASVPSKTLSAATKSNSKVNTSTKSTSKKPDPKTKSTDLPPKRAATSTSTEKLKPITRATKTPLKRKPTTQSVSSDSDFVPTPKKKSSPAAEKPLPRQVEKLKKRIDRRILSTDDESIEPAIKKDEMNYWIEVFCEAESKWICIDLFKLKVNCVDEIKKKATKPIAYVLAWNNNSKIKDVTPRYCSQWNTTTRKLRVEPAWLDEAMSRYKEPLSQRCVAEDRELEEIHAQTPIPTSISEFKNHPLYVLPRHLLKFEGIYPPNSVPLGYIRDEPIYSRFCVHTLHSREIWVKQARVVKPAETPYKIVKARPKWDRLANKMLEAQPLEIFGRWQTDPYVPPTAENGIVPRNAYGNVELFKPEMLPKKTCHLRLAGLNRVCAKLKIDCAQAVVGFDFHGGSSHPTFDGFVVCEEFAELVTERWCEEQEESYRKSKEKQNQRIYDNWKKLIKGLIIRERLQRKYNFAGKDGSTQKKDKV